MNQNEDMEELDPVGMIHQLACCFTQQRMMASQVAVLTAIAKNPAITSGPIVRMTGLSVPNTGRILNYLAEVGDVTFVREEPPRPDYPSTRRHFYITPEGVGTVKKLVHHLGWGEIREGLEEESLTVPGTSVRASRTRSSPASLTPTMPPLVRMVPVLRRTVP